MILYRLCVAYIKIFPILIIMWIYLVCLLFGVVVLYKRYRNPPTHPHPILIGLAGKKRSGKDTVAEYLRRKLGFVQMSFAFPLKQALKALFLLSDEQLNGDKKEDVDEYWGVSPRFLMQKFGTEIIRTHANLLVPGIGSEFWTRRLQMEYERQYKNQGVPVVVSDVRFPNEAALIREMGGIVIYIDRPSLPSVDTHASEQSMSPSEAEFVIENNTTIPDLYDKVEDTMDDIVFLLNIREHTIPGTF